MRDTLKRRVAIGFFDGVHIGHQRIVKNADEVITFSCHPLSVLSPEKSPQLIMSFEERLETLAEAAPRAKITVLDFTQELAALSPEEFAAKFLKGVTVLCGADWRFGAGGKGDAAFLKRNSYDVEVFGDISLCGEKVSSSRIRRALMEGDFILASAMLSRPYSVTGNTISGKGVGAEVLSCATLNIKTRPLPLKRGVYSVVAGGRKAVANYGVAPTFRERGWAEPVLEVHILDGDFSGELGKVEFLSFIRDERTFDSVEELKYALCGDCRAAKDVKKLLSVVVPTKNEESNIANCLKSFSAFGSFVELIVVDNSSSDSTKTIAASLSAKVLDIGPERSTQRNLGWHSASSEWVLFLDADMIMPLETLCEILMTVSSGSALCAYWMPEVRTGGSWRTKIRNFERSFYNATPVDALRLFRRDVLVATGGFDENLFAAEDWDLDIRVLASGVACGILKGAVLHNEKSLSLKDILRKKAYYTKSFSAYKAKWPGEMAVSKQFSPLYRYFWVFMENGKWKKVLRHPILFAAVLFERVCVGAVYLFESRKGNF